MRLLSAFLCLLFCGLTAQAQETEPQFFPPAPQKAHIVSKSKAAQPLVIIGPRETTMGALILSPEEIEIVRVYKGEKAKEKFGDKGKEGVVVIELKKEVPLVRLPEILDKFNVSEQGRKLTVAIDGKHVPEPELLLADLRQIKKVEVKLYDVTAPSRWTFDEEYLNIETVQ